MSFEFFIGRRYLRAKRKQAFISLITLLSTVGVAVGVMALIVVIAVMAGAESDLRRRILSIEPQVVVTRVGGLFRDYRRVEQSIAEVEGVVQTRPFIYSQVMLRSSGGVSGAILRGVALRKRSAFDTLADRLPWEAAAANKAPARIFLGKELARSLKAKPEDVIFVIAPGGRKSGLQSNPARVRFEVAGIVDSGMHEFDKNLAFVSLPDAQQLQGAGDAVTGIEVKVADIYAADSVAERISAKVGFPYWARDWMRMNHNLFLNLKLQKAVMFIILTLIVLVAAFNIASTLIMMVMEKTKDIAILKAMGATDGSIRKIFVFKGMTIGAVGTLVGSGLGFVLCRLLGKYQIIDLPADVYYFSKLPVQLEWPDVLVITAATMLICFLATLYPSHKASRLNPVETIRYSG